MRDGIRPRAAHHSNWEAASCDANVYLTSAYAMYFAHHARRCPDEDLVIVEVDSDRLEAASLLADEDAVWFAWQKGHVPEEFHPADGLDKYGQSMHFASLLRKMSDLGIGYEASLAMMGNCAYEGTVPVEAITRVVRYSAKEGPWWLAFHDPIISPLNFVFHGSEYMATQLVLADRLDEARQIPQFMGDFIDLEQIESYCGARRSIEFDASPVSGPVPKARKPA
jgi:hypothetical protein